MRSLMHRTVIVALWTIGALVGLIVVLGGALVWRLSSGPMSLGFLTPRLENALDTSLQGRRVEVRDTILSWDAERRRPLIQAQAVTIRDAQGNTLATFPKIDVWLSLRALVRGTVGLTAITLQDAEITLLRSPDGIVLFGVTATGTPSPQSPSGSEVSDQQAPKPLFEKVTDALNSLVPDTAPSHSLDYLQEVHLSHGSLTVQDKLLGVTWKAPQVDVTVSRHRGGLTGRFHATLPALDDTTVVDSTLSYNRSLEQLVVEMSFSNLRPSTLATVSPTFNDLSGVDLPLNGTFTVGLDLHGVIHEGNFAITGGPGTLAHPSLLPQPQSVASVVVRGGMHGPGETFHLEESTVIFGTTQQAGPTFKLTANGQWHQKDLIVTARTTLTALPLKSLRDYWPAAVSPKPRAWLTENLTDGTMEQASATIDLAFPGAQFDTATVKSLKGTLRYRDLHVHYLRPLPPAIGVMGSGTFDLQGFVLQIDKGTLEQLTITAGAVDITGLDRNRDAIAVKVNLKGPLRNVLTVLNHPDVNLLKETGIDPATVSGQVTAQTTFALSLRGVVPLEKVDITAHGTLQDVSLQGIIHGHNVERGQLALQLSTTAMTLQGTLEAAAVPLTVHWHEAFSKKTQWRREIHALIPHMGETDLARLGVEAKDFVQGTFAADVTARMGWEGTGDIVTVLNLHETNLTLPFLGWHKPVGEPGKVQGTLQLVNNRPVALNDIDIAAGTLTARGVANFAPSDNDTISLNLTDLVLGNNRLSTVSMQHQQGNLDVRIGESVLDAHSLLRRRTNTETAPPTPMAKQHTTGTTKAGSLQRFTLHAPTLRRIAFGEGRYLQNVALRATYSKAGWESLDIAGQIPLSRTPQTSAKHQTQVPVDQHPLQDFTIMYRPSPQGSYTLTASVEDIGAFLYATTVLDSITGGHLTLEGVTTGPVPSAPLRMTLRVQDFIVKDIPLLARVLAAASPSGLINSLSADGLRFNRLRADVVLQDDLLTLQHLHTHGGGLGLTAEGEIDLGTANVNLKGTVIPVQGINTLVGKIPVLNLLVGGKGQGIIATNYAVTGPFTEPKVTVNPASMLTPGFLRKVFDLADDPGEVKEVPVETPLDMETR